MIVGGGHALADQYRVRPRAGVVFDLDRAESAGFRPLAAVIRQIGREFNVKINEAMLDFPAASATDN